MRRAERRKQTERRAGVALGAAALGLLGLAGVYLWALGGTRPPPAIGGPFTLTNDAGRAVTDRDFRGQYLLVYFGYTLCPDICPTTLAAISDAVGRLHAQGVHIRPLFVTIDPEHDTPAVLHSYISAFGPDLVGLSGTRAQIRRIAAEYRITVETRPRPGAAPMIDHTAIVSLVGPDGSYLTAFPATEDGSDLAAGIARRISRSSAS